MSFSQNTKHIALIGDFNSRTSNLNDYILPDEELINEILDIVDDDVIESMFSHQILQHHDVPLDRCSEDRARPNTHDSAMCHFLKIYRYLYVNLCFFSKLCFSCSHRNRFAINRQCTNIYCIIAFLYFAMLSCFSLYL